MTYREYSWYAQRIVEFNALKNDTSNLNFQLRKSDEEIMQLNKAVQAATGTIKNKDITINKLRSDNIRLYISGNKSDAKAKRWKQTSLVLGSCAALLLGLYMIK